MNNKDKNLLMDLIKLMLGYVVTYFVYDLFEDILKLFVSSEIVTFMKWITTFCISVLIGGKYTRFTIYTKTLRPCAMLLVFSIAFDVMFKIFKINISGDWSIVIAIILVIIYKILKRESLF